MPEGWRILRARDSGSGEYDMMAFDSLDELGFHYVTLFVKDGTDASQFVGWYLKDAGTVVASALEKLTDSIRHRNVPIKWDIPRQNVPEKLGKRTRFEL